jgi:hypothetical protein
MINAYKYRRYNVHITIIVTNQNQVILVGIELRTVIHTNPKAMTMHKCLKCLLQKTSFSSWAPKYNETAKLNIGKNSKVYCTIFNFSNNRVKYWRKLVSMPLHRRSYAIQISSLKKPRKNFL